MISRSTSWFRKSHKSKRPKLISVSHLLTLILREQWDVESYSFRNSDLRAVGTDVSRLGCFAVRFSFLLPYNNTNLPLQWLSRRLCSRRRLLARPRLAIQIWWVDHWMPPGWKAHEMAWSSLFRLERSLGLSDQELHLALHQHRQLQVHHGTNIFITTSIQLNSKHYSNFCELVCFRMTTLINIAAMRRVRYLVGSTPIRRASTLNLFFHLLVIRYICAHCFSLFF